MSTTASQTKSPEEIAAAAAAAFAASPEGIAAIAAAEIEAAAKRGDKTAMGVLADKATVEAAERDEASKAGSRPSMGTKVLVSGKIASQVNPLTNQFIPHGLPVVAVYDRWIEIQIEADVLAQTSM